MSLIQGAKPQRMMICRLWWSIARSICRVRKECFSRKSSDSACTRAWSSLFNPVTHSIIHYCCMRVVHLFFLRKSSSSFSSASSFRLIQKRDGHVIVIEGVRRTFVPQEPRLAWKLSSPPLSSLTLSFAPFFLWLSRQGSESTTMAEAAGEVSRSSSCSEKAVCVSAEKELLKLIETSEVAKPTRCGELAQTYLKPLTVAEKTLVARAGPWLLTWAGRVAVEVNEDSLRRYCHSWIDCGHRVSFLASPLTRRPQTSSGTLLAGTEPWTRTILSCLSFLYSQHPIV